MISKYILKVLPFTNVALRYVEQIPNMIIYLIHDTITKMIVGI